jgi:hypothetical protein
MECLESKRFLLFNGLEDDFENCAYNFELW